MNDAAQLAALREGDEAVFAELVRTHHAELLRTARAFGGNEEIVREAWIAFVSRIDAVDADAHVLVFRILIEMLRSRSIARSCPIARAIADLPPGERVVLVLRDVLGWEISRIGEVIALSEMEARAVLHRARRKLCASMA